MKYFPTYLLLLLVCSEIFGQKVTYPYKFTEPTKDTIYLSELDHTLDKRKFNFKLDSDIFSALIYKSDTLVVSRLRFSHYFGKLPDTLKQQLFATLNSRNKIDTDQIIAIHYRDTLQKISDFPPHNMVKFSADSSSHWHLQSHRAFIKMHKKCHRRFKRFKNSNVFHFFSYNNGHPTQFKKLVFYKDNYKLIGKIFKDKYRRFNQIVLHPDGRYFAHNYYDGGSTVYDDIIRGKNWDKHQQNFDKKLKTLNSL